MRRQSHLAEAADLLLLHRPPDTPVFIGRNLGRNEEEQRITCLSELSRADIDMLTVVLVGSNRTRQTKSDPPRLYTPRGYFDRSFS
jgi:cobalt-precorrin 5A hydrolase/precorrin-3B C17-methyltransferase